MPSVYLISAPRLFGRSRECRPCRTSRRLACRCRASSYQTRVSRSAEDAESSLSLLQAARSAGPAPDLLGPNQSVPKNSSCDSDRLVCGGWSWSLRFVTVLSFQVWVELVSGLMPAFSAYCFGHQVGAFIGPGHRDSEPTVSRAGSSSGPRWATRSDPIRFNLASHHRPLEHQRVTVSGNAAAGHRASGAKLGTSRSGRIMSVTSIPG